MHLICYGLFLIFTESLHKSHSTFQYKGLMFAHKNGE